MGLFTRVGRVNAITATLVRHGLGHYLGRRPRMTHDSSLSSEDPSRAALRFRALLEDLGPTFIKFGQVLSTRPDLLPQDFVESLRGLQDRCPAMPEGHAETVIARAFGKTADQLFASFDPIPVASASIAQVHRATLHTGEVVAVKIRRSGVRRQIVRDLELLRLVGRVAEAMVTEARGFAPSDFVEEFESAFLQELDFEREAAMLSRFAMHIEDDEVSRSYVVPKVYTEFSCDRVVTMQWMEGCRIEEIEAQDQRKQVAENLVRSAFKQLFWDGLFHADPHPGNVLVSQDSKIIFIDFGSVGEVSAGMRQHLLTFALALAMRDAASAAQLMLRVGAPYRRVSLDILRQELDQSFQKYLKRDSDLGQFSSAQVLRDIFDMVQRHRLRLPRAYAVMARAVILTEGVVRQLDPALEVVRLTDGFAQELFAHEVDFPPLKNLAMQHWLRGRSWWNDAPLALTQILLDLERGQSRVQIHSEQLDRLVRTLEALGVTLFLGLVTSGLITGSMFLLAQFEPQFWIPLSGMGLACAFLGAAFGRYWLSPVWRRLNRNGFLGRMGRRGH